jgi:ABC-type multidrug transport system fused ATPase/permease subunit
MNVLKHFMDLNISRYGKFGSSPDEIEAAAKSAQMHERIISFPDGNFSSMRPNSVLLILPHRI